jgi:hypothetical protein
MTSPEAYNTFIRLQSHEDKYRSCKHPGYIAIFTVLLMVSARGFSQELEPRSLTNVPVGTNFAVLGYGFASGNILFDPALPLEDVNAQTHIIAGAYVRSFNFFGMGAKANVILPFAAGDWEGVYQGDYATTARTGMGDMHIGFSFNFIGSPALKKGGFKEYEQKTIAGFSMQVVAPTGQNFDDRLINLGSNRWAFRPQLGVSHKINSWFIEYAINTWLFTTNEAFWDGNKLKQNPMGTIKVHITRAFNNGIWASLGGGYAFGGRSFVNDVRREAAISVMRVGAIIVVPINPHHSLKLTLLTSRRFAQGAEFESVGLAYQFIWN